MVKASIIIKLVITIAFTIYVSAYPQVEIQDTTIESSPSIDNTPITNISPEKISQPMIPQSIMILQKKVMLNMSESTGGGIPNFQGMVNTSSNNECNTNNTIVVSNTGNAKTIPQNLITKIKTIPQNLMTKTILSSGMVALRPFQKSLLTHTKNDFIRKR